VKQHDEIVSIDEGKQIDRSDEHQQKANSPIAATREPGSNLKSERALHERKQLAGITSTDEGMQTDCSVEQDANAPSPRTEM
jgi:hypothetical protein